MRRTNDKKENIARVPPTIGSIKRLCARTRVPSRRRKRSSGTKAERLDQLLTSSHILRATETAADRQAVRSRLSENPPTDARLANFAETENAPRSVGHYVHRGIARKVDGPSANHREQVVRNWELPYVG